jgi:hypothetical protein
MRHVNRIPIVFFFSEKKKEGNQSYHIKGGRQKKKKKLIARLGSNISQFAYRQSLALIKDTYCFIKSLRNTPGIIQ